jgi:hypothetical protein
MKFVEKQTKSYCQALLTALVGSKALAYFVMAVANGIARTEVHAPIRATHAIPQTYGCQASYCFHKC